MQGHTQALKIIAASIAAMSGPVLAGTAFQPPYAIKEADTSAYQPTVSLNTGAPKSGDQIHGTEYDFTPGGTYVSTKYNIASASQITDVTHVRIRVRAPATASLGLRLMDETNQILQYSLNRTGAMADDQGWETHLLPVSSRTNYYNGQNNGVVNGKITQVALLVQSPGSYAALPKKGTAYLRGVEFFTQAPVSTDPVLPQANVDFSGAPVVELTGAPTNVSREGGTNKSGDAVQKVYYNFQAGGAAAGVGLAPSTAAPVSYVRLRARAASANAPLVVRVTYTGNPVPQEFTLNATYRQQDGSDWSAYTLPLGPIPRTVSNVAVVVKRPASSAYDIGTFYVRELELLDRAPSASQPLVEASLATTISFAKEAFSATAQPLTTAIENNETVHTLNYSFASTQAEAYVSLAGTVTTSAQVNRLRFAAQVGQGIPMAVRFIDNDNKEFITKVFKPLATVDTQGFAQYSVSLESNDGRTIAHPIKKVSIRLERAVTNSNTQPYSILAATPTGTAKFKNILLTNDGSLLDLRPATPTLAGMRPRNSNPAENTGIAVRYPRNDAQAVADMGFKYVRMDMTWKTIQTDPINNSPFKLNAVTDVKGQDVEAILNRGMKPVLILAYGHTAYGTNEKQGLTSAIAQGNYFNAYIKFVQAVATRYRSSDDPRYANIVFEIWNEPNHHYFWQPAANPLASEYAPLLKAATEAIHQIDPNRVVVSGGLANIDQVYLKSLVQDSTGVLTTSTGNAAVNGLGLHPYADQHPESQGDEVLAAMAQLTTPKQGWFTEVGTSGSKASRNPITAQRSALDTDARLFQAMYLDRQVLTSWATNRPMHIVFRYRDDDVTTPQFWQPDYFEHNWGLIGWSSKDPGATLIDLPAKTALTHLLSVTNDRTYKGMLTGDTSNLQAMKFSGIGQETVYVVWANAVGSTASFSVPSATCNTNRNLKGDYVYTPSCVLDMLGNAKSCAASPNGRQICTIREEDGPVYVRMPAS